MIKSSFLIILMECAERYSFFAMKSILIPFSILILKFKENDAKNVLYLLIAVTFLLPIIIGYFIDKGISKVKLILIACFISIIGHLCLIKSDHILIFFLGISIVGIGAGFMKVPIVSLLSDQEKSSKNFTIYYFASNIAIVIAATLTPLLFRKYNHYYSFTSSALMMIFSTLIFAYGIKDYKKINIKSNINLITIILSLFYKNISLNNDEKKMIKYISKYKNFLFLIIGYYVIYEHTNSTWILQAMHLKGDIFGLTIFPEQIFLFNPLIIIICGFSFQKIKNFIKKRFKKDLNLSLEMNFGFIFIFLSFLLIFLIEIALHFNFIPSIGLSCFSVVLFGIGEFFVYRSSLEILFFNSNENKNSIGGLFFGTQFVANLFNILLTSLIPSNKLIIFIDCMFVFLLFKKNKRIISDIL